MHPSQDHSCSICGSPIPNQAPDGFCPACLLRDAAPTQTSKSGPSAPAIEIVAQAFPHLQIESLIGQGGMGFVYKAVQPSLDRPVALKILAPELGGDPAFVERFSREARMLGKLNHPNIVSVYETGQSGGFLFLMMEYVDGVNLRQAMKLGKFTPQQALSVIPGICDALHAAHSQGIWHRDIKPENILLDAQGKVKIADFGIARLVDETAENFTLTRTGAVLGSAAYMAPEQIEKPHSVDHRADIYSLGVVFYEMLTGELPLGRFAAPSAKSEVDVRIDAIVFRTLEKERELRQQSVDEVKTDVLKADQQRPGQKPARRPTMRILALVAGLVLMAIAGWQFFQKRSEEETWSYTLRKLPSTAALEILENIQQDYPNEPVQFSAQNGVVTVKGPGLPARRLINYFRAVEQTMVDPEHKTVPLVVLGFTLPNSVEEFGKVMGSTLTKIIDREGLKPQQIGRALLSHVLEWENASFKEHESVVSEYIKTLEVTIPCANNTERPLKLTFAGWGIGKLTKLDSISPWLLDEAKTMSAEPFPEKKKGTKPTQPETLKQEPEAKMPKSDGPAPPRPRILPQD